MSRPKRRPPRDIIKMPRASSPAHDRVLRNIAGGRPIFDGITGNDYYGDPSGTIGDLLSWGLVDADLALTAMGREWVATNHGAS